MNSTDKYMYFILTDKPDFPSWVSAGHICYMKEHVYNTELKRKPGPLATMKVFFLGGTTLDYPVKVSMTEPLSIQQAELLEAVGDDSERLRFFRERKSLQTAQSLTVGTEVSVEEGGEKLRGLVRYIGRLTEPTVHSPLSGVFFGIELQGADRGKGKIDGRYHSTTFFQCQPDCRVLAPFSRVSLFVPTSLSPAVTEPDMEHISVGDRVTFFNEDQSCRGMVLHLHARDRDGLQLVTISTDTDENGKTGGEIMLPIQCLMKGDVSTETEIMDVDGDSVDPQAEAWDMGLTVNSMVEFTLSVAKGSSYGIIRWIGNVPEHNDTMAGLELEEEQGVSDGILQGDRKFTCPSKRALFIRLRSCRPDSRFQNASSEHSENVPQYEDTVSDAVHTQGTLETVPPISADDIDQVLIGRMKGIQGHCNSCYMDAALFSLFSCSSALDSMLFKATTPQDAPIQNTLLHNIVNPLRSKGFVEGQHIMKLRKQLQKHGYSHSFTTDEKDPEEFLIIIMHHILALDPLLKLSAGGKVQESYCYQIFLDQNHSLVLPTVQQLLEHSFHNAGLKLAQVPSCLILQMPRFGKKFKMFDKIVPSLELDITALLSEGPQQCILCGFEAQQECADCFRDPVFSQTGFKVFCQTCSAQVHSHPQRRSHKPSPVEIPKGYPGAQHNLTRHKLELFAVLCIETSHYVSFVKYGPDSKDWIFFDSMADRQGETDGFNIPEVHVCPEVGAYLEMSPVELANQVPRDMKGVAKRLFCDAYMYLYQNTSMMMYC
ncbi:ubiquitin carboxyl-terminal hydrolase CYLD isoform X2 [Genypterus blacodes]|uniref:ubiquitin carboxyl-terminal hydrolase CYLD isoform X2 n=1 Tax=Genypterus blacodes TaxID=154954 RepID=UPI003F766657